MHLRGWQRYVGCALLLLAAVSGCGRRPAVLRTETGPTQVLLDPRGQYLYVACEAQHSVLLYDTARKKLLARVNLAPGVLRMYLDSETHTLRVIGQQAHKLWLLKGKTLQLTQTLPLPADPAAWAYYPERQQDVFCSPEQNKVYAFLAWAPLSPIEVESRPTDLILEPGTDKLWVANAKSHSLTVLRLEQAIPPQRVPVHANPIRMLVSPQNGTLYVLCTGRDAYPAASLIQLVDLPNQKAGLTYSAGEDARDFSLGSLGKYLYSVSPQGLKIYNLLTDATVLIPTGKDPRSLAVSPDGSRVYIACAGENAVYVHSVEKAFR